MRLRAHRRNIVVWSPSAGSAVWDGAPRLTRLTRIRRIHRWICIGALLMVIGLMRLARAVRPRWRPLLAGGVLTVVGAMARGAWGAVLLPGVLFLLFALLTPATPKARRSEVERELGVFSHPAQRRLASQAIALYDKRFPGFLRY
jgi:H+/Cl- antiporter ClcA